MLRIESHNTGRDKPLKQDEFERLCIVSAQLKKGLENISSGRVESGRVWIEEAAWALNILLRIAEAENDEM